MASVLTSKERSEFAVEAVGVMKAFRREGSRGSPQVVAVDNLSFAVHRHEVFGILGPNGSGKSTLIRLVATLLWPDRGSIRVFGHDVRHETRQVRRLINRVSVEASFFKKLSAEENLAYAAGLYGVEPATAARRAREILSTLGFPLQRIRMPLENLSRGQQQKVAIARALLTSPTLLLLDEPTTGLDPRSKRDVQAYVEEVMATHDATTILCTHDMEEAARLCDRVAFIEDGRFVAIDTPGAFAERYGSLEAAFFALTGEVMSNDEEVPTGA
jgi:ABC-2 type transport system ATP-binding protein